MPNGDSGWDERARLGDAIVALPEPERSVVQLYYHGDLSESQIAQILDTTPEAVAQTRQRALAVLREKVRQR